MKVDVLGKLNATNVKIGGSVLTHMPEGSIVMWSGWTDELPDGWVLCSGVEGDGTTDQCNFVDYFIVGKEAGDTVNESVGAATYSIATSNDYEHKHVSSHGHGAFTQTGHNHANVNVANHDAQFHTGSSNVPTTTTNLGTNYYWTSYTYCSGNDWAIGGCWETSTAWRAHSYPRQTGYRGAISNGNHSHRVTINHGHTASPGTDTHDHTMADRPHEHENVSHSHEVPNEPAYFKLAFIYLKGES